MDMLVKKYKYQFIIVLLVLFNICVVIKNSDNYFIKEKTMFTTVNENKISLENEHQYKIKVYYPEVSYSLLNDMIEEKINDYILNFKNDINDINVQENQYYTLSILYDSYSYQDYISYVFEIESYIGGAHPNHDIWTITYDFKNNKIVTINDLIKTDSKFLEIVSNISREELIINPRIVDTQMLMDGTNPNLENFSKFAFSDSGLFFFFPHYQVAPYSSGSFVISIPYQELFASN